MGNLIELLKGELIIRILKRTKYNNKFKGRIKFCRKRLATLESKQQIYYSTVLLRIIRRHKNLLSQGLGFLNIALRLIITANIEIYPHYYASSQPIKKKPPWQYSNQKCISWLRSILCIMLLKIQFQMKKQYLVVV